MKDRGAIMNAAGWLTTFTGHPYTAFDGLEIGAQIVPYLNDVFETCCVP